MTPIAQGRAWRLAGWSGRLLLLGVVAFWWGAYVIPQLFSLAFPALLPPWNSTLSRLNASNEGTIANTVSAITLASMALLALATAFVNRRWSAGWIAVAGWAAIAMTMAALAIEELAEFKKVGFVSVVGHAERLGLPWPVLVSPLVAAFVLAIGFFAQRGLDTPTARAPLMLGTACWVFALVHETIEPWLFVGRARAIGFVLEETLEFSGTLLIGSSAALVLQGRDRLRDGLFGEHWRRVLIGSGVAVLMFGSLAVTFVFRAPVMEALAPHTRAGAFEISLGRLESVV